MSELSPDDPILLKLGTAPHEPSAILRMHNAGHRSQAILEQFRLRGTQLIKQIETARQEAAEAERSGRPIHSEVVVDDQP